MRDTKKLERWSVVVAERAESGLSVAAFCRERGLAAWQFHYWRRRLGEVAEASSGGFVEVVVAAEEEGSGVRVEVGGVSIVVSRGFDQATLSAVLKVVAGC